MREIRGTSGLHPRRNALDEIASNPRLLGTTDRRERNGFPSCCIYFDVLQKTADSAERRPEESGMENNPLLRIGPPYRHSRRKYCGFVVGFDPAQAGARGSGRAGMP